MIFDLNASDDEVFEIKDETEQTVPVRNDDQEKPFFVSLIEMNHQDEIDFCAHYAKFFSITDRMKSTQRTRVSKCFELFMILTIKSQCF